MTILFTVDYERSAVTCDKKWHSRADLATTKEANTQETKIIVSEIKVGWVVRNK
jgi:hypothetical protein